MRATCKEIEATGVKFDVIPRRPLQQPEAVQNETRPDATSITVSVTAEVHCDPDTRSSKTAVNVNVVKNLKTAGTTVIETIYLSILIFCILSVLCNMKAFKLYSCRRMVNMTILPTLPVLEIDLSMTSFVHICLLSIILPYNIR